MRNVKPTIYLAILNNGWNRVELTHGLWTMLSTSDLKFVFEDPQITRGQPASSVRNEIKKRFLQTSCEFLIMLDYDEVPFHDLVDLVEADKDIISCPSLTKKNGKLLWKAYNRVGDRYKSIDLDKLVNPPDFMAVDGIHSGCIIIKRRVLEDMKAPFQDVFDDDGVRIKGYDLEFCRRAIEKGFEVYTTPKKRCGHFKCVELTTIKGERKERK